jgi:hypothetical protein
MLEGARAYPLMKYCQTERRIRPLPDEVISTYVRFVPRHLSRGEHRLGFRLSLRVPAVQPQGERGLHIRR